jgi:haloacetate dehalogenase
MRFEDFHSQNYEVNGIRLHARTSHARGEGRPAVVLLHGYPQTSYLWHAVAPQLAEHYFVVCPDLRGYGRSDKPKSDEAHQTYSKRTMAQDIVELADALDIDRFSLIGHDRGARAAHRLALDHPTRIERLCLIDIAPTLAMYEGTDSAFATAYFHWFFLIQPAPLPERLLAPQMALWVRDVLSSFGRGSLDWYTADALAEYERSMSDPDSVHASCEDYRASATIDLEHDRLSEAAQEKIVCPLLAVWGERSIVNRSFDARALWQSRAALPIQSAVLPSGHFIPDENPAALLEVLEPFLKALEG